MGAPNYKPHKGGPNSTFSIIRKAPIFPAPSRCSRPVAGVASGGSCAAPGARRSSSARSSVGRLRLHATPPPPELSLPRRSLPCFTRPRPALLAPIVVPGLSFPRPVAPRRVRLRRSRLRRAPARNWRSGPRPISHYSSADDCQGYRSQAPRLAPPLTIVLPAARG